MIHPDEDKKFGEISALRYLDRHRFKVEDFLDGRVRKADKDFVLQKLIDKNPVSLASTIQHNYELSKQQRIMETLQRICAEGTLTIMLGAKRHGKTATTFWIAEKALMYLEELNLSNIYWFGYNPAIDEHYPQIKQTWDFKDIEDDSLVLFDESAILLNSREAMSSSNRSKVKQLPIIGHRGISTIFITQSGQMADVSLFLLADYVWFKPYFVSEFDSRLNIPDYIKFVLPTDKPENLLYDLNTENLLLFENPLPKNWNDELSKPFRRIETKEQARKLYDGMLDAGFSQGEIETIFEARGFDLARL